MPDTRSAAVDQLAPDDLICFLKAITDGRNRRGVRYPQWFLLLVEVLGIFHGEQRLARSCTHRSAAAGCGDRCAGEQSAWFRREPGRRMPPRRCPLAAGPEFCADRLAVAATGGGSRRQNSAGLDTDPAATPRALHP